MAGCAVINDPCMTENRRRKGAGYVTHATILRGRDMADILLGRRTRTIMTFCAVINATGVIKVGAGKTAARNTVAHAAIRGSVRMARRHRRFS